MDSSLRWNDGKTLAEVAPADWDRLHDGRNPFLFHAFLAGLERCGCLRPGWGWTPRHLTLWDGDRLVAAAPGYLKGNSHGEFVFDHAWAHAYARHGLDYYPKWLFAVPYSPVTGPRLLARDEVARRALLEAIGVRLRGDRRQQPRTRSVVPCEQPWPRHRRVGHREQPFRVVVQAVPGIGMGPGVVEHEFAMRVGLEVAGCRSDQPVAVPQGQVPWSPAPVPAQASMALEPFEEGVAEERVASIVQCIPLRGWNPGKRMTDARLHFGSE